MRFDKENKLIVADAYLGLYRVDIRQSTIDHWWSIFGFYPLYLLSETHEVLIAGRTLIDGKPLAFLNDLDIHPSTGEIIFTDSSTKWDRRHFPYILLEGRGDGR